MMTEKKFDYMMYGYGVDKDGKVGLFSAPQSEVKVSYDPAYIKRIRAMIKDNIFGSEVKE